MKYRYIGIEGPPGVGKSALVERMAARLEGSSLLEKKHNPFLEDCNAGRSGAAFQAQMFFLLNRYRELGELAQRELFYQLKLADFILAKDKIYAYLHLDDTELMLYQKIYQVLAPEVPSPELVVYLQAPADALIRRVRQRSGHIGLAEHDLRELVRAYDYFFFHYSTTPLLVVNASKIDFADPETSLDDLLHEIEATSGGTRYFVPAE